jgi:hypothetical protein
MLEVGNLKLIKRITMIAQDGDIEAIQFSVFQSDGDKYWGINHFKTVTDIAVQ